MKSVIRVVAIGLALSPFGFGGSGHALATALSDSDRNLYQKSFSAADRGNWKTAFALAAKAKERLPAKVLRWMRMSRDESAYRFRDIAGFIADNGNWPGQRTLRRNAERAMDDSVPVSLVRAWFEKHPPLTADGRLRLIKALQADGRNAAAVALIRETWHSQALGRKQERRFRRTYRRHLKKSDHVERLDNMLWDGRLSRARRVMPLVDPSLQKLGLARVALRTSRGGVDWHIRRVPAYLLTHPGFVYERVRWRRRKGRDDDAFDLLKNVPADSPYAEKWWTERSILARRLLTKGHVTDAYRIAHAHGLKEGARYAEAEWLSGWIALRYLEDGAVALRHFERIRQFVRYPISQARASYWMGRALSLMGDQSAAARAYADAARHGTTYYGQLAAAEQEIRIELKDSSLEPSKTDIAAFETDERVRAIRMLHEIRAYGLIRQFAQALTRETDDPARQVLVARLGREIGRQDVAVRVGRRAYRMDIHLPAVAYPVLEMRNGAPTPALSHAIIRQESNFEKTAISRAGARGMMQLMPRTARGVAKRLKVGYSPRRLTSDPAYNIRLGRAYLSQMLSRFDGSYVLSIAAYNAGPAAANRWMKQYGDPRNSDVDVIDWVESIPYRETRNYVQRVLENIQVYRIRLGEPQLAEGIVKDLQR